MQKVISINLNGNAYQLEEAGYHALQAYLQTAVEQLSANPDRAEIIADLEQAIAEKCSGFLGPHKSVVSSAEIDHIIREMGPVDPGTADRAGAVGADEETGRRKSDAGTAKRLYQIREGAMITGVCNGLAAYAGVDVTIVRIIFVVLAVLTKGLWLLVYVILSFVIPYAETSEQRAAAHGRPFSAKEVVDRAKQKVQEAKQKVAGIKDDDAWRQQWRRQRREWRRAMREQRWWGTQAGAQAGYTAQVWAGLLIPVFGLVQAAAFVLLALAIVSLVNTGAIFGWVVPQGIPLWAGVLALVILYQIVIAPFHAARYAAYYTYRRPQEPWFVFANGILSITAAVFGLWLAYQYFPEFREMVHNLPAVWEEIVRRF